MNYLYLHDGCQCTRCQAVRRIKGYDLKQVRQRYAQLMAIARMTWDRDGMPMIPSESAEFPMLAQRFFDLTVETSIGTNDRKAQQGPTGI